MRQHNFSVERMAAGGDCLQSPALRRGEWRGLLGRPPVEDFELHGAATVVVVDLGGEGEIKAGGGQVSLFQFDAVRVWTPAPAASLRCVHVVACEP